MERAKAAWIACRESPAGHEESLEEDQAGVIDRAEESLGARQARASDAEVESNILLAEEVWELATLRCHPSDPPDEALRHVLAKLAR